MVVVATAVDCSMSRAFAMGDVDRSENVLAQAESMENTVVIKVRAARSRRKEGFDVGCLCARQKWSW